MSARLRTLTLVVVAAVLAAPLAGQDNPAMRARQHAAAGEFREAASAWRQVLEAHPKDRSALAGLVDALEATGDWRTAIDPLDRLLELGPSDAWRVRQRGLYAAWSGDLTRAVELLRSAVAQRPQDAASLAALAEVLSWSPATRTEAAATFSAALARDSMSLPLMLGYADLLSWTPRTRDSAEALYRRVLSRSPGELRAQVGLANLLAWRGKPGRALVGYDSVLGRLPDDVGALRGRGGALNQLDRSAEALRPLRRALELSPRDASISGELARAELGTGRYRSARAHLPSSGRVEPGLRGVADSALRATSSAVEVSGVMRTRQNQLDLNRATARTTAALGSFKLYGEYERSELKEAGAKFQSDGFGGGVRLDHRGLTLLASAGTRTVQNLGPRQWSGAVRLGWRVADGFALQVAASRAAVEESRRSVQGELDGGQLRGAVHANLAHLGLVLDDLPGPFDAEANLQAGRYTGLGLSANRRLSGDARVGLVLHRAQPWIRLGYGFVASRFDYNADPDLNQVPTQRGGYFSPAEYWRHEGILQLSQRLGSRVRWEADGRLGREWVRQLDAELASHRNTAVATSTLTLRLASMLDLEARFLYVNAFDAFELKEFASLLKVYFP